MHGRTKPLAWSGFVRPAADLRRGRRQGIRANWSGEENRSCNENGDDPVLATTRRRLDLQKQGRPSPYFLSKNVNIFLYASSNSLASGL